MSDMRKYNRNGVFRLAMPALTLSTCMIAFGASAQEVDVAPTSPTALMQEASEGLEANRERQTRRFEAAMGVVENGQEPAGPEAGSDPVGIPPVTTGAFSGYVPRNGSESGPAPTRDELEEVANRNLPESIDVFVRDDVERLDRGGLLQRQNKVGEDSLIMDREIARTSKIKSLIADLGVEGFRAAYPELYREIKSSPMVLESEIRFHELQHDLKKAKLGPEEVKKVETPPPAPQPRDDGSSVFQMPQNAVVQPERPERPVRPSAAIAEAEAEAARKKDEEAKAVSVREIYGSQGNYIAVVLHGKDEKIRVRSGDILPNNTLIKEIDAKSVTVVRDGKELVLGING